MGKKTDKTNVMRILDQKKLDYTTHTYDASLLNAIEVAQSLNQNPEKLFKTLVTEGKSREHYVFMIPAREALDLKKAAKAAGEKSVEMIPQKELLPLTGYIHGGCSPIGMKKQFRTFIHQSAYDFDTIFFSGGRVGHQIEMAPDALQKVISLTAGAFTKE